MIKYERLVLWLAVEAEVGIWELLIELRQRGANGPEQEQINDARTAVVELMKKEWIELYRLEKDLTQTRLEGPEATTALWTAANWQPPVKDEIIVQLVPTDAGLAAFAALGGPVPEGELGY